MPDTYELMSAKFGGSKDNPHGGLCECGCGEPAPIATMTQVRQGAVKGRPQRYIRGHRHMNRGPDYLEEDRGYVTPCLIWQKGCAAAGYGVFCFKEPGATRYTTTTAHRAYYEREYGSIPEGLEVDHLCRVRACVNPAHLEAVTHAKNMQRGALAKLTHEDVAEIRVLLAHGIPHRAIAGHYGVQRHAIGNINTGRSWR